MNPICVSCQRLYQCTKNGVNVALGDSGAVRSDLYTCPGCGHQILSGFGRTVYDGVPTNPSIGEMRATALVHVP